MMKYETVNDFNGEHPLGKGEVVSSILTGSTSKAHVSRAYLTSGIAYSAVAGRTPREHDTSTRGKSGEFVQAAFALCEWAMDKPWDVRMRTMIAVRVLRLLARHNTPELRAVAMRHLERLGSAA
jgi:hypothetical protein